MPSEVEISPEEKLLRVIQGDDAAEVPTAEPSATEPATNLTAPTEPAPSIPAPVAARESESDVQAPAPSEPPEEKPELVFGATKATARPSFRNVLTGMFSGVFQRGAPAGGLTLPGVNHYLGILVPVLAVFVLYDVYRLSADRPDVTKMGGVFAPNGRGTAGSGLDPMDAYVQPVRRRNMFRPPNEQTATPTVQATPGEPGWMGYVRKNLSLLGLSWDPNSPADSEAIIKDTGANTVFFLKQGQRVDQKDIVVKQVFRDRIILGCSGREMELR